MAFIQPAARVSTSVPYIEHRIFSTGDVYVRARVHDQDGKLLHVASGRENNYLDPAQTTAIGNFVAARMADLPTDASIAPNQILMGAFWTLLDSQVTKSILVHVIVIGADGEVKVREVPFEEERLSPAQLAGLHTFLDAQRAKAEAAILA